MRSQSPKHRIVMTARLLAGLLLASPAWASPEVGVEFGPVVGIVVGTQDPPSLNDVMHVSAPGQMLGARLALDLRWQHRWSLGLVAEATRLADTGLGDSTPERTVNRSLARVGLEARWFPIETAWLGVDGGLEVAADALDPSVGDDTVWQRGPGIGASAGLAWPLRQGFVLGLAVRVGYVRMGDAPTYPGVTYPCQIGGCAFPVQATRYEKVGTAALFATLRWSTSRTP